MKVYRVRVQELGTDQWATLPGRYSAEECGTDNVAYDRARNAAQRVRTGTGRRAIVVTDPER